MEDIAAGFDSEEGDKHNVTADPDWAFWSKEIEAARNAEYRFRDEGQEAEEAYFGESNLGKNGKSKGLGQQDRTNIIHANIETTKPLMFSARPEPVVRRRFAGDGEMDPVDGKAAETAQRLCAYLVDTSSSEEAIAGARDDWLIVGRGVARAVYYVDIVSEEQPIIGPDGLQALDDTGAPSFKTIERKENERVELSYTPWRMVYYSPTDSWRELRWMAFETHVTFDQAKELFGKDTAKKLNYTEVGRASKNDRGDITQPIEDDIPEGRIGISSRDRTVIYEIWDKKARQTIWWAESHNEGLLGVEDDPLGIADYLPAPKPLLSVTLGASLIPRSSIAYYKARADEVDKATKKIQSLVDVLSLSGLVPADLGAKTWEQLFGGQNKIVEVRDWLKFSEKGGIGAIQWLPIEKIMTVIQSLIVMRDQSKAQIYEISGISDIIRGQTDAGESATAQRIKGQYASTRLKNNQRQMQTFIRDTIRIMFELAIEHFDAETIKDIVGIEMPLTEAERQQIAQDVQQALQAHEFLSQQAQQLGQQPPPPPNVPDVPDVSYELVLGVLRDDKQRKFNITIETDSTILVDEQYEKEARIEFIRSFADILQGLAPMIGKGGIELKHVKELLLFGVRSFPKGRVLEEMLLSLPDELPEQGPPQPSIEETVAQIRAEMQLQIAQLEEEGRNRRHSTDAQVEMQELQIKAAGEQGRSIERLAKNLAAPQQNPIIGGVNGV